MKIICISGKARHGKDTVAKCLSEHLKESGNSVLVTHFADLLKYVCKQFFGWDGEKDEHGRSLLQYVGTDRIRGIFPNYWVSFIINILTVFNDEWDYVIIPDCRFPNEYELFRKYGFDVELWKVVRDNFDSGLTEEQLNHPSETALDDYVPTRYIYNNGTLEEIDDIIECIMKEVE